MSFLAAIAFDPAIRGVLVVMVGVVVLLGSLYVLLATNMGLRLGFLLALAGLFGWLFSMGIFWWIYGIGMVGTSPSWVEKEVNFDRTVPAVTEHVDDLPDYTQLPDPVDLLENYEAENPEIRTAIEETEGEGFTPRSLTQVVTLVPHLKQTLDEDMNGWRILPESDSRRGEAVASADATLANSAVFGSETGPSSYTVKDVFFYGGKSSMEPETIPGEYNAFERAWHRISSIFQVKNPVQYAAVTVQKNVEVTVAPGEAPPPAQVDETAEVVTVVFQRNLGNKRMIPALFTFFTGILFFTFCWMLHTRDKRAMEERAAWNPAKAG